MPCATLYYICVKSARDFFWDFHTHTKNFTGFTGTDEIQSRFCLSTILHSPINIKKLCAKWNKKFSGSRVTPLWFFLLGGVKREENFTSSSSFFFPLRFTCSCEWTHDEDEIIRPDWFLPMARVLLLSFSFHSCFFFFLSFLPTLLLSVCLSLFSFSQQSNREGREPPTARENPPTK